MGVLYASAVLCVFVGVMATNDWLMDLSSSSGVSLGDGVVLKLDHSKAGQGLPIIDRLSVDYNISDNTGINFGRVNDDKIVMNLYMKNLVDHQDEARTKRDGNRLIIPLILGYKTTLIVSVLLGLMKLLSLKALLLAKTALLVSLVVLFMKVKGNKQHEVIELTHNNPLESYAQGDDSASSNNGYDQNIFANSAQATNMYPDIMIPSGAGSTSINSIYASSTKPSNQAHQIMRSSQNIQRRSDLQIKPIQSIGTKISIKKYSTDKK